MDIIKQTFGLDISKDSFVVCFGTTNTNQKVSISKGETFNNNKTGFNNFFKWIQKNKTNSSVPLWFIMEATGVYYENLAYFLDLKGFNLCVLLPNKSKNYAKTLDKKSKTDSIDARVLTQFGLERNLNKWEPPSPLFKELKSFIRERIQMKSMIIQLKNQLHARSYSYQPSKKSIKRTTALINYYKNIVRKIEEDIENLLQSDEKLYEKVKKIESIKGIGIMTIASILAETNGFALVRSRKQLASYAGLDVVLNESGKRKGKTKISKKGNRYLRESVYMPALSAVKWNPELKRLFERIVRKRGIKKIALIAVARKLLLLVYTLWKNDQEYIPNFQATK